MYFKGVSIERNIASYSTIQSKVYFQGFTDGYMEYKPSNTYNKELSEVYNIGYKDGKTKSESEIYSDVQEKAYNVGYNDGYNDEYSNHDSYEHDLKSAKAYYVGFSEGANNS